MNFIFALLSSFVFFQGTQTFAQTKVHLAAHKPPAGIEHCKDCHLKKSQEFILAKKKTELKHADYQAKHGRAELSCGNCHDRNNFNDLRTSEEAPATYANPSPVCKQCHQDIYKDWLLGMHGKRLGGWNLDKVQLHCTDCHSPHSVRFKQMKADQAPIRPKLGFIKKHGEGHGSAPEKNTVPAEHSK